MKRIKTVLGPVPILLCCLATLLAGQACAGVSGVIENTDKALVETPVDDNKTPADDNFGLVKGASSVLSEEQVKQLELEKITLFREGYQQFRDEHFQAASVIFYRFMAQSSPDEENYQWAQFFFGLSLEKQRLSHASIDILADLAKRKPNIKIVSYVLEMFESISRSQAFDREMVLSQLLNSQDYDFDNPLIADFVHYYQGVDDWQNGLVDWGNQHFHKLQPSSYYHQKYLYHQAQYQVYQGSIEQAIATLLELIAEQESAPSTQNRAPNSQLMDEARWTLARLFYERGDYQQALEHYRRIQTPLVEHASFLLEQAWNVYQQGDAEKAMGFLYAFEAPSFKRFFSPEFYILKSFIYKNVCHYDTALAVVDEFQQRYGRALDGIYQRATVADQASEEVLNIALTKPKIAETWRFLKLLENENRLVEQITDEPLRAYIAKIYELKIDQTAQHLKLDLNDQYEAIANTLLQYQEEANLMRYEIGIDMYQRVSQSHFAASAHQNNDRSAAANSSDERTTLKQVVFPFQGEFWNEELGNYQVKLANKCNQYEEWDVFFK